MMQLNLMDSRLYFEQDGLPGTQVATKTGVPPRLYYCAARPRVTREAAVLQWSLMEASVHYDTAGPQKIQ